MPDKPDEIGTLVMMVPDLTDTIPLSHRAAGLRPSAAPPSVAGMPTEPPTSTTGAPAGRSARREQAPVPSKK